MVNIATITLLDLSIIVKEYSDLFKVGATSNCLLICYIIFDYMLVQSLD